MARFTPTTPAEKEAATAKAEGAQAVIHCGDLIGVNTVKRAIEEPMRWIAANAGQEGSIVVQKVREMKDEEGFNALTDTYENLVNAGVIDPAKVVKSSLSHAVSVAGIALLSEALIADEPEEKNSQSGGGMPGGMGMGDMDY